MGILQESGQNLAGLKIGSGEPDIVSSNLGWKFCVIPAEEL